jgi:hypothetical protein
VSTKDEARYDGFPILLMQDYLDNEKTSPFPSSNLLAEMEDGR